MTVCWCKHVYACALCAEVTVAAADTAAFFAAKGFVLPRLTNPADFFMVASARVLPSVLRPRV